MSKPKVICVPWPDHRVPGSENVKCGTCGLECALSPATKEAAGPDAGIVCIECYLKQAKPNDVLMPPSVGQACEFFAHLMKEHDDEV